ncbi:MAG: GerMN domain-containing protein [Sphaerochaeta sp.]|nr:GerMN domain-containing protein [Sphaerochaeta sp.]
MDDNEEKQGIPSSSKGSKHLLVLFGIWLIFTATVLIIGLPIVRESIRQSGVLTLLKGATETPRNHQQTKIWFYSSDGSLREYKQEQVKQGGSVYHDTFESLLSGPKLQALKEGAISSIDPKTSLQGLTLSNKVLYIDLSKHFLESENLKRAYEQLRRTGKGFPQIKDIVLLIEGERATLSPDL